MKVQLWSYNYEPEPTGIAPLSTVWAKAMRDRGHAVEVVAAHPHYPEPRWGQRLAAYREDREGISVLRLPLWVGRATTAERIRQELTFSCALTAALPALKTPDVVVAVSPSFPALAPAILNAQARRIPWVLWLQDVLPDGATATGLLREGRATNIARRFERFAYRSATHIVVISDSFSENLQTKGVPETKISRIYNPASRPIRKEPVPPARSQIPTVLTMGNVGRTQNLEAITRAFQESEELSDRSARLVIAGDGVAGEAVRAEIHTDRVEITGIVDDAELEGHLRSATVALVSQRYEGIDFNVPSKLMNFMGYGIPVVASVRSDCEVARIIQTSEAGWVTDSAQPSAVMAKIASVLDDPGVRELRGKAGLRFAQFHFGPERLAERFEQVLQKVTGSRLSGVST